MEKKKGKEIKKYDNRKEKKNRKIELVKGLPRI